MLRITSDCWFYALTGIVIASDSDLYRLLGIARAVHKALELGVKAQKHVLKHWQLHELLASLHSHLSA